MASVMLNCIVSFTLWTSGLCNCVVLHVDTNISEEYAVSILRVEESRVRLHLGYVVKLQGWWLCRSIGRERIQNLVRASGECEKRPFPGPQ